MGMTYGERSKLKQRLVKEGAAFEKASDCDAALQDIGEWYSEWEESGRSVIDTEDFAELCEYARNSPGPPVRRLALGALFVLASQGKSDPGYAKFAVEASLQWIHSMTGKTPLWSVIELSDSDRREAEALLEAAYKDRSFSDEDLKGAVDAYAREHGQDGGIFGRLASDLAFLLDVMGDQEVGQVGQEKARAALTYFAFVSDAIPDDLGPVGFLDDIYIVNKVVRELRPERSAVTDFLDTVLSHWPFVSRLAFEAEDERFPVSEYLILNAALLLEEVRSEKSDCGTAVLVPEVGPLSLLIGFIRAIAEVSHRNPRKSYPEFKCGERLINRDTNIEIEFRSYGRLIGSQFIQCPIDEAEYFQFVEIRSRNRGGETIRSIPIASVYGFRRRSDDQRGRKRGELVIDPDKMSVGPLEQLLGSSHPIILPRDRGRVVVVAPIQATRNLARSMTLFGSPLADIIPMGSMVPDEDHYAFRSWTTVGAGGAPMLTVVTKTSDAAELAEDPGASVVAVISSVRPESPDAVNLQRIASDRIPVIAFVEGSDIGSHSVFEKAGFAFWVWDDELCNSLHWTDAGSSTAHPVAQMERRIRNRLDASISVEKLDLEGVSEAEFLIRGLQRSPDSNENELISHFIEDSYKHFFMIARHIAPVTPGWTCAVETGLGEMEKFLRLHEKWWPGELQEIAIRIVGHLRAAADALLIRNPKFEYISNWMRTRSDSAIVCTGIMGEDLRGWMYSDHIILGGVPSSGIKKNAAVIPAWLGRDRMNRLLSPPIASETQLALYGPEMEWFRGWKVHCDNYRKRFRHLASRRKPFKRLEVKSDDLPEAWIDVQDSSDCPDDMLLGARRRSVIAGFAKDRSERAEGRLVHFAGGSWAVFSPKRELPTLVNLLELDLDGSNDADYIRTRSAADLQVGEMVLLLRGSDSDAIRALVDKEPEAWKLRQVAMLWQTALREDYLRHGSIARLKNSLERHGCTRSYETILEWLESERIIGPRHGLSDIEAIQRATENLQLLGQTEMCFDAISHLRSLHLRAARVLSGKVLERARLWLDAGAAPDDLVEVEDRLVLATVEAVDPESIEVPRRIVNQIQEARWPG